MECPECEGKTRVIDSGEVGCRRFAGESHRAEEVSSRWGLSPCTVRVRQCSQCANKFITLEGTLEDFEAMLEDVRD